MARRVRPSNTTWAPRLDVTAWPFDERARAYLTQFRQERIRDLGVAFCGDDLDLRGAHLCGFDFREGWFSGAVLDRVRLLGANLTDATMTGASLERADLTGCVLTGADLSRVSGRRAVLAWARLRHAEIYEADLREADLIGADLGAVVLAGSDLRGSRLEDVAFWRTALKGARLADSVVAGAEGSVYGPVDISKTEEPELLDGTDLVAWFRERKATVTLAHRRS